MTWSEKYCIKYYNGHLASFVNESQLDNFISMKASSGWTPSPGHGGPVFGYNAIGQPTNDADEWYYTDGIDTDFARWNSGDPDDDLARCGMFPNHGVVALCTCLYWYYFLEYRMHMCNIMHSYS